MDIIPILLYIENKGGGLASRTFQNIIGPENGLLKNRNNLDPMVYAADYYCIKKYEVFNPETLTG